MYPFFESIAIIDGKTRNLSFHQERVNRTFLAFYPKSAVLNLEDKVSEISLPVQGKFKLRIVYNEHDFSMDIHKYVTRQINKIYLKENDSIDYSYKYTDRSALFYKDQSEESECIFIKNKYLTDSVYSNLVLWDGAKWYTPANPLLNGTMRSYLLEMNIITEDLIPANQLKRFKNIQFINALNHPSEQPLYPISIIQSTPIN